MTQDAIADIKRKLTIHEAQILRRCNLRMESRATLTLHYSGDELDHAIRQVEENLGPEPHRPSLTPHRSLLTSQQRDEINQFTKKTDMMKDISDKALALFKHYVGPNIMTTLAPIFDDSSTSSRAKLLTVWDFVHQYFHTDAAEISIAIKGVLRDLKQATTIFDAI